MLSSAFAGLAGLVAADRDGATDAVSCGLASTESSLVEPGRCTQPMRTAPTPTATSASTMMPTRRSVPDFFWPPPGASDLAAILVPLLLVARRGPTLRRVS